MRVDGYYCNCVVGRLIVSMRSGEREDGRGGEKLAIYSSQVGHPRSIVCSITDGFERAQPHMELAIQTLFKSHHGLASE